jgi:UrcA family protein
MFARSAVIAAVLGFAALPAQAAGVVFHYKASALDSAAGARDVYDKIAARAEAACNEVGARGLWRKRAHDRCEADVVSALVAEIGDPSLAEIHAASADYRVSAR